MEGDLHRLVDRLHGAVECLANDIGRRAEAFADIVERLPVGRPHGRCVLAGEIGHPAAIAAVGVAEPDVVIRRAAIPLAVPRARAADVGDLIPLRREHPVPALGAGDALDAAARDRDRVQLRVVRKIGAARRGEEDGLAVGRPAVDDIVGRVECQPLRLAAHGGDDEDVVAAVPVGAEGDHAAVGAEDRIDVVGLMHGHGTSDAADGLDGPDIAEVAEGNQPAVGRDVRRAAEAYRFLSTNAGKAQKRRRQSGQKRAEGMHGGVPCCRKSTRARRKAAGKPRGCLQKWTNHSTQPHEFFADVTYFKRTYRGFGRGEM